MRDYITEERLLSIGPQLFFNRAPFLDRMTLREIHAIVCTDYRRAVGKFGRPSMVIGKEHHVAKEYTLADLDVVVEILPTPDNVLLGAWKGEVIEPCWRVRIARDPNHRMRGLKDTLILAPRYTLGKVGSSGPFMALAKDKSSMMSN